MSAKIVWEGGGEAVLVELKGDHVTWRSTRPFPPGAPPRATLDGPEALPVTVKVAGSHRNEDGSYTVRGRLVSATVALRAALRPPAS